MLTPSSGVTPRSGLSGRLGDVFAYLDQRACHEVSQREAASRAGLSPSAFSHAFKKCVGLTFEAHVNALRVQRACHELARSGRPIIDVAFEAGFNSIGYFNRRFREATGMTPSAYRRQMG